MQHLQSWKGKMDITEVASTRENSKPEIVWHSWGGGALKTSEPPSRTWKLQRQLLLPHLPSALLLSLWIMENDSWLTSAVKQGSPIAAVVPDVVSVLKQISMSSGTWYAAREYLVLFFLCVQKDPWSLFAFNYQGQQCTFTVLLQGYINFPALCHN